MTDVTINAGGSELAVHTGAGAPLRFHAVWLRDNAWDSETRSAGNGQRLITVNDIPADVRIAAASVSGNTLSVTFAPENKTVDYDFGWLARHAYDRPARSVRGWTSEANETWDKGLTPRLPRAAFNEVKTRPGALRDWLAGVARYGVGVLTGGPVKPEALLEVAALFGYVRETNYGRYFEVRTEVNPTNLA